MTKNKKFTVEKRYATGALIGWSFYGLLLGLAILGSFIYESGNQLLIVSSSVFVVSAAGLLYLRRAQKKAWLDERPVKIAEFCAKNGYSYAPEHTTNEVSPTLRELSFRDRKSVDVIRGKDWNLTNYSYAIYRKTKNGHYKSETIYYQLMHLALPRKLPHLLFDSKKSRGQQFRLKFDASQKHSLEGDFDKYFTTYFPKHYSIDSLSLIGPEVMQAMVDASEYDIEIVDNDLYLFGGLEDIQGIENMILKGQKVRQSIINEAKAYRDERLEVELGRKHVANFGARLRMNPFRKIYVVFAGLFIIGYMALTDLPFDQGTSIKGYIYGFLILGSGLFAMLRVWLKNRQLDQQYQSLRGSD